MSKTKQINEALKCFEALEADSSKLAKAKILTRYKDNKVLQHLLKLALSKTRFHVKPKTLSTYTKSKGVKAVDDAGIAYEAFCVVADTLSSRKVTGAAAIETLTVFLQSIASQVDLQKWLHRVLCKKLRCGVDAATIQDVWPGLVIPFGVPKGASLVDQKRNKIIPRVKKLVTFKNGPVISQPKCDGIHGIANLEDATFQSSSGAELPMVFKHAELLKAAIKEVKLPKQFKGYAPLISGECLAKYNAKKDGARWDSMWGKGSVLAKLGTSVNGFDPKRIKPADVVLFDNDFYFEIYDLYPEIAHIKAIDLEYDVKAALLARIIKRARKLAPKFGLRRDSVRLIAMKPCKSWADIDAQHVIWMDLGYEGSILRVPGMKTLANSKYRLNFFKLKKYAYVDAVILGVVEGKKNTKNEGKGGSFLCWLPVKKSPAKVTIPTDAAKDACWKYMAHLPGSMIEASQQSDAGGDVAVSRFPVMSRFRDDLPQASEKQVRELWKNKDVIKKAKEYGVELVMKRNDKTEHVLGRIATSMQAKHVKKDKVK